MVTATSPAARYAYTEMVGGQDHSRLASMTYPNGRIGRSVYHSGIDSAIGRTTAIAEDASGSVGAILEAYKYLGLGTVVERARPNPGIKLSYVRQPGDANLIDDGNDPYTGLDRFGRIADRNRARTATVGQR